MNYLDALRLIHDALGPRNYVEIGCRRGLSLSLTRCPAVAVDPDFEIVTQIEAPVRLYRLTSDDFFAHHNLSTLLDGSVDLAFIDGMHNAEFVLRDFINLEAHSNAGSVIVIDDVLPEQIEWTTRDRRTEAWTGDVYKVIPLLRTERPDLRIDVFDIAMKGMAIISNLNRDDTTLLHTLADHERWLTSERSELGSVAEIRRTLQPRPVAELEPFVDTLRSGRAVPAT